MEITHAGNLLKQLIAMDYTHLAFANFRKDYYIFQQN